jgi:anaerobic glycerol-3-phosphate dehydrogenase
MKVKISKNNEVLVALREAKRKLHHEMKHLSIDERMLRHQQNTESLQEEIAEFKARADKVALPYLLPKKKETAGEKSKQFSESNS